MLTITLQPLPFILSFTSFTEFIISLHFNLSSVFFYADVVFDVQKKNLYLSLLKVVKF